MINLFPSSIKQEKNEILWFASECDREDIVEELTQNQDFDFNSKDEVSFCFFLLIYKVAMGCYLQEIEDKVLEMPFQITDLYISPFC